MSKRTLDNRRKTAEQQNAELLENPDYQARMLQREQEKQESIKTYLAVTEPIVRELADLGFEMRFLADLRGKHRDYRAAMPLLLRWLPQVSYRPVQMEIIHSLAVKQAGSQVSQALIAEFRRMEDFAIRWAIADALSVVADDKVFEEVVNLVLNKNYGQAREMLAVALGNMKNPRAADVLVALLDDEELVGHAIIGLRKLKAKSARKRIESLVNHRKAWVRKEARKALATLK